MGRNTSVILGEHFDQFMKSEIQKGRYGSASEMIRAGLRILEEESNKIRLINEALVVGEESGEPLAFDNKAFKEKMRNDLSIND